MAGLSSSRSQIGRGAGKLEGKSLYKVHIEHNCVIVCPDGTELAGDIYRPLDAAPCPALITMLPYHKDAIGGVTSWDANHYFAERGYATVLVDFRGTGASGGRPRPLFDPAEAEDGVVAVEWAANQPWCDGTVGMWGVSYGAVVALRTASLDPAPLRAVLSVMGLIDPERDLIHPSGLRGCLGPLGVFGLTTLVQQLMPPVHRGSRRHLGTSVAPAPGSGAVPPRNPSTWARGRGVAVPCHRPNKDHRANVFDWRVARCRL